MNHPYTSADEQQTVQALETDTNPTFNYASTNQWVFHLYYQMPDGQGDGGSINCVRSVSVEYFQDPKAQKLGVSGIRGIQDSYVGIKIG